MRKTRLLGSTLLSLPAMMHIVCRVSIVSCAVFSCAAALANDADFPTQVRPFLNKYCLDCHGGDDFEGDVQLSRYNDAEALRQDRRTWEKVLKMLEFGAMPPRDAERPSEEERQRMVRWLEQTLFYLDCDKIDDPGHVTIRRLNRTEYDNTIRDLFGVDLNLAKDFPSDDVGEGFDNIGDVLSLPPLLMEKYLDAAERTAQSVIVANTLATAPKQTKQGANLDASGGVNRGDGDVFGLFSNGYVRGLFNFPQEGEYEVRVLAGAEQAGPELAQMSIEVENQRTQTVTVEAARNAPAVHRLRCRVPSGQYRVTAAFTNDYYNPLARDRNQRDRNLYISSIEVVGPLNVDEHLPASHKNLITVRPSETRSVEQAAREVLKLLLHRVYRRRVEGDALERYVALAKVAAEKEDSFERGIQVAVSAMLVAPEFLFRIEPPTNPADPRGIAPVDDFALASRLSYFLWSSMPDNELFALANQGKLRDPNVLRQQVARMIASPKANALVENFAGQWLNLRNLTDLTMDETQFPEFDKQLRADMQQETQQLFAAVMHDNLSIFDLLDADFTFLNERLARFYGIPDVSGNEFRRVSLAGSQRAGVLMHASVLTLTSNPTRTSPVKRGKWVMENILGTPPPDPPPNVPELDEIKKSKPDAPLREQMVIHRENPVCASCHVQMDAIGFGLENFDAVGRWRERDGKHAIDPSGVLPSGESFRSPQELVAILKNRKKQFSRTFTEKMLTYALGRGLTFHDRCTVDKITAAVAEQDYRFVAVVTEIVLSDAFRKQRGE